MTVKISVIVPIFRTEKYLDKCIESIRSQTLSDIEIICVDDCSPDNSSAIVERHMLEDPRIKLVRHEENLGLGGARNTAIQIAAADYIASVDSDDYIAPEMLSTLWAATENGKYDIVSCGFDRVDENGNLLSYQTQNAAVLINNNNSINIFGEINPAFWNKLWRRSIYVDNNITFPNYVYYQDAATTPRIISKCKNIKIINERLYFYLIRPDSATYTYSSKHIIDYLKLYDILFNFLVQEGIYEHFKNEFYEYIDRSTRFHAQNIADSNMDASSKLQYLRHFLIMKIGFLDSNEHLYSRGGDEIIKLLGTARTRRQIVPKIVKTQLPISIIVKTFLRPDMLERFLLSVGEYEACHAVSFAEIIVGDDSPEKSIKENVRAIELAKHSYIDLKIKHEIYDENIGLASGRNRMVQSASSDYILLCDDDFILDEKANLIGAIKHIESGHYDMIGGWLKNNYNLKTGEYTYWGAFGDLIETEDELIFELNESENELEEIQRSDYLLNFFLVKRTILLSVPWNERLKLEEHQEFFYRFKQSSYKAALFKELFVKHTADRKANPKEYNEYRFGAENWERFLYASLISMGKNRRTINRWRNAEFISWQVDRVGHKNIQKKVLLKEPIIGQRVSVSRITPKFRNFFFGYYDVQSISDDGRYVAAQSCPVFDRLPVKGDYADIVIIDLKNKNNIQKIGNTSAWCHQQGAQLQFVPNRPTTVIYNIFNKHKQIYQAREIDFASGVDRIFDRPIAAISAKGDLAASINFSRLYDYRAGYGYCHIADPFVNDLAPEEDGLYILRLTTGEINLVLSYREICDQIATNEFAEFSGEKFVINHVSFNPECTKILMLIRTFSDEAPFPTFTVICDIDGKNLKRVFGFSSHYHWKDKDVFVTSGAPGFKRLECKNIGVFEVNTESLDFRRIGENVLREDGHCSYSPDRSLLLYDSYSNTKFPYRRLQVYDLVNDRSIDLAYFFSDGKWFNNNTDLRCDLHPRWSNDGNTITFDSIHEGFRGIYSIDVQDVINAFDSSIRVFDNADLRRWYTAKYDRSLKLSLVESPKPVDYNEIYKEACLAYHASKYDEALDLFHSCLEHQSNNANLRRCIAETLLHLNLKEDALNMLMSARAIIPNNKNLRRRVRVLRNPIWSVLYQDNKFLVPN